MFCDLLGIFKHGGLFVAIADGVLCLLFFWWGRSYRIGDSNKEELTRYTAPSIDYDDWSKIIVKLK